MIQTIELKHNSISTKKLNHTIITSYNVINFIFVSISIKFELKIKLIKISS